MLDQTLLTLKDKSGNIVKRVPLNLTLSQVLNKLGFSFDTDSDDKIEIESEGLKCLEENK